LVVTIVHESEESDSATTLEVGPPPVLDTIWANVHNYHKIKGQEKVQELVDFLQLQTEVCFDTETTDLDPMKAELVGLSFSYITGEAFYIPVTPDQQETQAVLEILGPFFENEAILKIGQNVKYDILVLKNYGIEVKGKIYDTMLAHYLIDPDGKHGMDWLAQQYLHYSPVSITELIGKKGKAQGNMRDVDEDEVTAYASEDADITLRLKEKFDPILTANGLTKLFDEVENPLIEVLSAMEFEGVRIDTQSLAELSILLDTESKEIEKRVYELAGVRFNLAS